MPLYFARFNRETPAVRHDDALGIMIETTFKKGSQIQLKGPPLSGATILGSYHFAEPPDINVILEQTATEKHEEGRLKHEAWLREQEWRTKHDPSYWRDPTGQY